MILLFTTNIYAYMHSYTYIVTYTIENVESLFKAYLIIDKNDFIYHLKRNCQFNYCKRIIEELHGVDNGIFSENAAYGFDHLYNISCNSERDDKYDEDSLNWFHEFAIAWIAKTKLPVYIHSKQSPDIPWKINCITTRTIRF